MWSDKPSQDKRFKSRGEDTRGTSEEVRFVDPVTFKGVSKDSVGGRVRTTREESAKVVFKGVEDES